MRISSRRSRTRAALIDGLGRLVLLAGIAGIVLVAKNPWWAVAGVPLTVLGAVLTAASVRARRDAVADEALESAAEYDRQHPASSADEQGGEGPQR